MQWLNNGTDMPSIREDGEGLVDEYLVKVIDSVGDPKACTYDLLVAFGRKLVEASVPEEEKAITELNPWENINDMRIISHNTCRTATLENARALLNLKTE